MNITMFKYFCNGSKLNNEMKFMKSKQAMTNSSAAGEMPGNAGSYAVRSGPLSSHTTQARDTLGAQGTTTVPTTSAKVL